MFSKPQREMMTKGLHEKHGLGLTESAYSAQQRTMIDRMMVSPVATTEKAIRRDLATAHRFLEMATITDGTIWNHASARSVARPGDENCCDISPTSYLITPGGMHFNEITPEDLVFDSIEESGNPLHSGIYEHRPDVVSIVHVHSIPIMAISAMKCGFKFLTQDSATFYNRIGYHDWQSHLEAEEEKERVAADLGPNGVALILRNHGAVTVGRSIQEAVVRMYYLDRMCRVQLAAMSAHAELIECDPKQLAEAAKQKERFFPDGKYEWPALTRLVHGRPLHGREEW